MVSNHLHSRTFESSNRRDVIRQGARPSSGTRKPHGWTKSSGRARERAVSPVNSGRRQNTWAEIKNGRGEDLNPTPLTRTGALSKLRHTPPEVDGIIQQVDQKGNRYVTFLADRYPIESKYCAYTESISANVTWKCSLAQPSITKLCPQPQSHHRITSYKISREYSFRVAVNRTASVIEPTTNARNTIPPTEFAILVSRR